MRSPGLSLLAMSALVGCQQILGFETPSVLDASNPDLGDAGPCAALSAQCLGDVLRACTTIGAPPVDTVCSWACGDEPQPHCLRLAPTGGGVTSDDLDASPELEAVTVMSSVVIDGSLGTITGVREAGAGVGNGIGFEIRNNIGVFTFRSLHVMGTLTLRGTNAIALVASGEIRVGALIDAQGACSATSAGPGGGEGGGPGMQESAPGSGGGGVDRNGGGGGGNGVAGGVGGIGSDNGSQTPSGPAFGTDTVTVLRGGGGGGGGGVAAGPGGQGGGGGGAVQLVSNTSIDVMSTIHAGGCGGNAAGGGGGGGGAGGTIVLEAPTVTVAATALLAVNGGGGAGGGAGSLGGTDALAATSAAGGGQGGGGAGGRGGSGGASAMLVGAAGAPANAGSGSGGGGGGGVGRIRINTRTGTAAVAGTLSPSLGPLSTATVGLAVMQ